MPKAKTSEAELAENPLNRVLALEFARIALEKSLTIETIVARSGIGTSTLLDILHRRGNPTVMVIDRLARALEVAPERLLRVGMPLERYDLRAIRDRNEKAVGKGFVRALRSLSGTPFVIPDEDDAADHSQGPGMNRGSIGSIMGRLR
jgi:transcriptional regulator with XRE-family HTH domain